MDYSENHGTSNNKIIGIHKGGCGNNKFNVGIDLKYPINEYLHGLNIIKKKKDSKNEIFLNLKIEEDDINKEIYFLDNTNGKYNIGDKEVEHRHDGLKELNEDNTELYIFHAKQKYKKFIIPTKVGNFDISLKFNTEFKDCSFMFYNCSNITNLDLSSFKTKNVTNMSNMFYWCKNLKNLVISNFDTNKATNMSNMFAGCNNLSNLNISSFDIKKDYNTRDMFNYCNMTTIKIKKDSNETLVKQIPNKTTIVKK